MIQSRINLYVLAFDRNSLNPKLLIDDKTGSTPELDIDGTKNIPDLIESFCINSKVPSEYLSFKIIDSRITDNILYIDYYAILPFGYVDAFSNLVDVTIIDEEEDLSAISKIIGLLSV